MCVCVIKMRTNFHMKIRISCRGFISVSQTNRGNLAVPLPTPANMLLVALSYMAEAAGCNL